ncbi:MAG TPA: DUF4199 domain-containing protein [Chryseosolibacter sp.]
MEQNSTAIDNVTTRSAGVRYGLIAAVIGIVYFLALTSAGIDMQEGAWRWVGYVITIVLVVLAHKYFKDNNGSFMSYGQGVGIAFWLALVSSAINSVFTYIYIKFVDTAFMDSAKQKQIEQMQERGMSDEQIDQAMQISAMFMTPEAIFGFALVFGIIGTVIIGLIISIFTQKKAAEQAY